MTVIIKFPDVQATATFPGLTATSLVLDASISQQHERTAKVTHHPVEKGADVTDNIVSEPKVLNVVGFISATPIYAPGATPSTTAHIDAFGLLELAWKNKIIVSIQTELMLYQNMAIHHLAYPRTLETGRDLHFTIELTEVIYVNTKSVNIKKGALGAAKPAAAASGASNRVTKQIAVINNGTVTKVAATTAVTNKVSVTGPFEAFHKNLVSNAKAGPNGFKLLTSIGHVLPGDLKGAAAALF